MSMRLVSWIVGLFYISFIPGAPALAWGEAGHDIVTRAAVRLMAVKANPDVARAFLAKEHMLAHLSNVPDIVWRNQGKKIAKLNSPTHFVDAEYLFAGDKVPAPDEFPQTEAAVVAAFGSTCSKDKSRCVPGKSVQEKIAKTGTAPWRIAQLAELMGREVSALTGLKGGKKTFAKKRDAHIDDMLLYAGIMSHFIGDLANPMHTSKNYDGWENGQGGLHGYFEGDVVDALALSLPHEVFEYAKKETPFKKVMAHEFTDKKASPSALARSWAIVRDSQASLHKLFELDKSHSLVKESKKESKKRAERKSADEAAAHYHQFVVERLALAADALSDFWIAVWRENGEPSFAGYHSFAYPVSPAFIAPPALKPMGKG